MNRSYPTDLSDAQWERLLPLLPAAKTGGRPRSVDLRAIINAIFYMMVADGAMARWAFKKGAKKPKDANAA